MIAWLLVTVAGALIADAGFALHFWPLVFGGGYVAGVGWARFLA